MTVTHATILKRAAVLAVAGTWAAVATDSSFARNRGAAVAGAYYYGTPYDTGPIYASGDYPTGVVNWGNTNSIGPNRASTKRNSNSF